MRFEYDPYKSLSNRDKHGLDFEEAKALWLDPDAILLPARSDTEPRFMAVGRLHGRHWSVFFTFRREAVRIISARRSRENEVAAYEQNIARRKA